MRKLVLSTILCLLIASPALARDASICVFYSPERLGLSNPVFLSFSGAWDRGEDRILMLDAGMNYQSKFDVGTYWLGGYGIRFQDRLGLAISTGGMGTPAGGSFVIGPNVKLDLVGPLSLQYIGLQTIASERGSQIDGFTHLIGLQIRAVSF